MQIDFNRYKIIVGMDFLVCEFIYPRSSATTVTIILATSFYVVINIITAIFFLHF